MSMTTSAASSLIHCSPLSSYLATPLSTTQNPLGTAFVFVSKTRFSFFRSLAFHWLRIPVWRPGPTGSGRQRLHFPPTQVPASPQLTEPRVFPRKAHVQRGEPGRLCSSRHLPAVTASQLNHLITQQQCLSETSPYCNPLILQRKNSFWGKSCSELNWLVLCRFSPNIHMQSSTSAGRTSWRWTTTTPWSSSLLSRKSWEAR